MAWLPLILKLLPTLVTLITYFAGGVDATTLGLVAAANATPSPVPTRKK